MRKTKLTIEEVKHIANLANLGIESDDLEKYRQQLSEVIDLVRKLQTLEVETVEETSQVSGLTNVFRQDEVDVTRTLSQSEATRNAKKSHNGYFVVPKTF